MSLLSNRKMCIRICAAVGLIYLSTPQAAQAFRIVNYNLLNYSSGRIAEYQTILNQIQPDIIVSQEVVSLSGANYFLNNVLNASGGPGGYTLATFHANGSLNNACFFRSSVVTLVGHTWLDTAPRDTDRWQFRPVGYSGTGADFYIYSMHLHSSDATSRANQTLIVRNNANLFPAGTHFIYTGDFNIDSSNEQSYQNLIGSQADNDGRGFDPINMPGTWHNSFAFRFIHTQSPHSDNPGAPPGAATGGVDDRFDFQLVSAVLDDSQGLSYVDGTYHAFGNDGLHFNLDINDAPTIPEGSVVANALHGASDHLPVVADYQVPAVILADEVLAFGTVIVGAASPTEILTVENIGNYPLFEYVDELNYSLAAPAGFQAPVGNFVLEATDPAAQHQITLNTTTSGSFSGNLVINSDAVEDPQWNVQLSGVVLRHAQPSWSDISIVTDTTADFGPHATGEFTSLILPIYNYQFDALQAQLEVYDAQITGPDAAHFSISGGFQPMTIGAVPQNITLQFDDSGPAGTYTANLILWTRDPQGIPGTTELTPLQVDLSAELAAAGYVLNLTDFPFYHAIGDTLIDQQYQAGPAVTEMILDYLWWDSDVDSTPPQLPQHAQNLLYAELPSRNGNPALPYIDAVGVRNTLQALRPLPYGQYGYNFSISSNLDALVLLKTISQWIDYPIGTYGGHEPGHPLHVPAAVPAYGDYSNWMAIRGIHTDQPAYPLPPALIVHGFWINDPVPGGIGENSYKTAAQFLSSYYLPLNQPGDPYHGKYLAIVEPPDIDDATTLQLGTAAAQWSVVEQLAVADWAIDQSPGDEYAAVPLAADRSVTENPQVDDLVIRAAIMGAQQELGEVDEEFAKLLADSQPGQPWLVSSLTGSDYFIVPMIVRQHITKPITAARAVNNPQQQQADTVIVILIDAQDGHFLEAAWNQPPVVYPPITAPQAQQRVRELARKKGIPLNGNSLPDMTCVYTSGNPYYPQWWMRAAGYLWIVEQDGMITIVPETKN
ncbi:MAG: hypothetical protein HJJLKODD_00691 [Phycisphaerae bacterium]|nr:hypothetical protein [Phycisphaerae bacterium]